MCVTNRQSVGRVIFSFCFVFENGNKATFTADLSPVNVFQVASRFDFDNLMVSSFARHPDIDRHFMAFHSQSQRNFECAIIFSQRNEMPIELCLFMNCVSKLASIIFNDFFDVNRCSVNFIKHCLHRTMIIEMHVFSTRMFTPCCSFFFSK